MDNLVKSGGSKKTFKQQGYMSDVYKKTIDVGGENKNVTITFGASNHNNYTNTCYLKASNDNSNFIILDTATMPDDETDYWGSDNIYGSFFKTLYNQPYRYYKLEITPADHGLGNKCIHAIWEEWFVYGKLN